MNKNILYLTNTKPKILTDDNYLDKLLEYNINTEAIIEYCNDDTVHSIFNITFKELFIIVFDIIINHQYKEELLKILDTEMKDSICKCFTGRITRLVNVLNGFDSNIKIEINETEQIGAVLSLLRDKYSNDEEFKKEAEKELKERGYNDETIKRWLVDY
jgi:WD40 repeat protein